MCNIFELNNILHHQNTRKVRTCLIELGIHPGVPVLCCPWVRFRRDLLKPFCFNICLKYDVLTWKDTMLGKYYCWTNWNMLCSVCVLSCTHVFIHDCCRFRSLLSRPCGDRNVVILPDRTGPIFSGAWYGKKIRFLQFLRSVPCRKLFENIRQYFLAYE